MKTTRIHKKRHSFQDCGEVGANLQDLFEQAADMSLSFEIVVHVNSQKAWVPMKVKVAETLCSFQILTPVGGGT